MKLEEQVVSLELAKKLKELGVKQESLAVWYTNADTGHLLWLGDDGMRPMEAKTYSAFTIAELGSLLNEAGPGATIEAYGDLNGFRGTRFVGNLGLLRLLTEPDQLAKMLIYLIENKLTNKA